jgi:hypothetical protein
MTERQGQLFSDASFKDERPPILSRDQWNKENNAQYHGTFRQDWGDALSIHAGSKEQATRRLADVTPHLRGSSHYVNRDPALLDNYKLSYFTGDDGDEWSDELQSSVDSITKVEGTVHAVSHTKSGNTPISDNEANAADVLYHDAWGESPTNTVLLSSSIQASDFGYGPLDNPSDMEDLQETHKGVADALVSLDKGTSVEYHNLGEQVTATGGHKDPRNISTIIPRGSGSFHTYDHYVRDHESSTPIQKDAATRRINSGMAGAVQFDHSVVNPRGVSSHTAITLPGMNLAGEPTRNTTIKRPKGERMEIETGIDIP